MARAPVPLVDVDAVEAPAFGLADELEPFASRWHAHRKHQLLYSAAGALHLEVEGAQWLLPPQRAAWLPAALRHRVRATGPVALRTVYLDPGCGAPEAGAPRVFSVSPLAREMILYAMRWGPAQGPHDPLARAFFGALGALLGEWLGDARPYYLPAARSPELGRAMRVVLERVHEPLTAAAVAREAGLSTRTLARRFADEAQTTWRRFLHDARMLRAMDLLARPGARVTEAAFAVGFESLGAFSRAFERFVGESPRDYRRRVGAPVRGRAGPARGGGPPPRTPGPVAGAASECLRLYTPSPRIDPRPMAAQRPPGRVHSEVETPHEPHVGSFDTIVSKAASPVERSRGVLSVLSGADAGRVMALPPGAVVTLGRADECTYRFDDISLSRVHARLMFVNGQYIFHDAGSTNGSAVNGAPARAPLPLRDGDRLQLGTGSSLRFALVTEDEERALVRAYEASMRDGLTGVFNRKHLDERLEAEVAFAQRHLTPLTVIMADVDHFKRVNDVHGHLAGDAVLRHVAGLLGAALRAEDLLARYGGEEFVVVARSIALDAGLVLAERLRQTVAQTPTYFQGAPVPVTLSAGVASLACCGPRADRAALIGAADARLYRAKATGRNRVVGPEGEGRAG